MAKFFGKVGYAETVETFPGSGIWQEAIVERDYYGDVTRNSSRWNSSQNLNDNLSFNNTISIIADAYAYKNYSAIRYVKWMESLWKVTSVEVSPPRLILSFGGVYNGPEAESTEDTREDSED